MERQREPREGTGRMCERNNGAKSCRIHELLNCYDKPISTHWCPRGTGSFMQTYFCKPTPLPTPLPMQSLSSIPPDQVEDNPWILSWQIMMMKYFEGGCLILKMMWWSPYWMLKVMDMAMSQPMLQKSMYDVNLTSPFWSHMNMLINFSSKNQIKHSLT